MEKYSAEVAKILSDAKRNKNWALDFGYKDGKRIITNSDSDSKEILSRLSVFTTKEFDKFVNGYEDLEIKEYTRPNPYSTKRDEDGIYIENCSPLDSLSSGRYYAVVKDNKKLVAGLFTKNKKSVSYGILDHQEDGVYIYSSDYDEIRFVSNERIREICNHNRSILRKSEKELSDEEIIDGLTNINGIFSLCESGVVVANKVFGDKGMDEEKANYMFKVGVKEYMRINASRINYDYEQEIPEVEGWQR